MCGICGVVQLGGAPRAVIEEGRLEAMTDLMAHRGPDDRGFMVAPGVAFGARRLSIVDVAGGHQPFSNEDKTVWGIQNGELYNHLALRTELAAKGHAFRTRCDTEILPHLYEDSGAAYPERLRGKFATAVWDGRNRRAVVSRDRLGVKPLYWARRGDLVVFASELKSLLGSGLIERELDLAAVDAYLTLGYVPFPGTPFVDVWKLPPGCSLVVEDGEVKIERYWEYPVPTPSNPRSRHQLAEELRELLREAVRLRLMSDVPLGAMLSGGLDSSVIVALMAEASPRPVKTFTVAFREDGDQNELESAARVARLFGCDHESVELSFTDTELDLDDLVWYLDEPVAELSAFGFHVLSGLASQHVTVALAGQGADELFGGYRKHAAAHAIDAAPGIGWISRPLTRLPLGTGDLRRFVDAAAAPTSTARLMAMSGVPAQRRRELYGERLSDLDLLAARRAIDARASRLGVDATALGSTLFLDAQLALADNMLHYFDRMSMAHSLEVRVPFLDHVLVEWAAGVPDAAKVGLRGQKLVLREAARDLVPADIIERKKVAFFRRSAGRFLAAQVGGGAADRMLEGPIVADGLVRRAALEQMLRRFRSGERSDAQQLLAMLVLDLWLERFARPVDSVVAPPEATAGGRA